MAPMSSLARRLRKTRAMNDRPYKKMRKNILSSMILVPFVPFLMVVCIGYYYFTNSIQNSTISNMRRIIEDHRHMIESFLSERKGDLEFILRSYSFQDLRQPSVLSKVLADLQVKNYSEYTIKNRRGHIGFFIRWCPYLNLIYKTC